MNIYNSYAEQVRIVYVKVKLSVKIIIYLYYSHVLCYCRICIFFMIIKINKIIITVIKININNFYNFF